MEKTIFALGFFDGVHLGHQSLLSECVRLAEELDCEYINVAEAVIGEDGCLKTDLTWDGVHLNIKGCKIWLEYLKTHSV